MRTSEAISAPPPAAARTSCRTATLQYPGSAHARNASGLSKRTNESPSVHSFPASPETLTMPSSASRWNGCAASTSRTGASPLGAYRPSRQAMIGRSVRVSRTGTVRAACHSRSGVARLRRA